MPLSSSSTSLFWALPPWSLACSFQSLPCLPLSRSPLLQLPWLFLSSSLSRDFPICPQDLGWDWGSQSNISYYHQTYQWQVPGSAFKFIECSDQKVRGFLFKLYVLPYIGGNWGPESKCGSVNRFLEPWREDTLPDTLSRSHFIHLINSYRLYWMPTASGTVPSTGIQQSDRNLCFVQGDREKTSIKQNITYVSVM